MGAKKRPFYRFVATDSRNARDGRFIEVLGFYHPIEKPAKVSLNEDKVYYWLENGAEVSDTVSSLFKEIGLWDKWSTRKAGGDISGMELKSVITERIKKKKAKKAEQQSA